MAVDARRGTTPDITSSATPGKQDPHDQDRQLARALVAKAGGEHVRRAGARRDHTDHGHRARDQRQQRADRSRDARRLLGPALRQQPRVDRDERRRQHALAQQILQHVRNLQRGLVRIRSRRDPEEVADRAIADEPGDLRQQDPGPDRDRTATSARDGSYHPYEAVRRSLDLRHRAIVVRAHDRGNNAAAVTIIRYRRAMADSACSACGKVLATSAILYNDQGNVICNDCQMTAEIKGDEQRAAGNIRIAWRSDVASRRAVFGFAALKVAFSLGFYASAIISLGAGLFAGPGMFTADERFLSKLTRAQRITIWACVGLGLAIAAYETLAFFGVIRFDFFLELTIRCDPRSSRAVPFARWPARADPESPRCRRRSRSIRDLPPPRRARQSARRVRRTCRAVAVLGLCRAARVAASQRPARRERRQRAIAGDSWWGARATTRCA